MTHYIRQAQLILAASFMLLTPAAHAQNTRVLTATRDLYIDATRADLLGVSSLLVGKNGDIIMRQMLDGYVRYFDSRGTPFTFGRKGDGPNEFRNIRANGFVADTLWLADISHRRLTFLTPARTPLRTVDYPSSITTPGPNGPVATPASFPVAVYADGSLLWYASATPASGGGGGGGAGAGAGAAGAADARGGGAAAGRGRGAVPSWSSSDSVYTRPLVRTTRDGQFVKVVAWRPQLPRCGVSFPTATGSGNALIPFCTAEPDAASADGDRVALITAVTATATSGTYRLTVIGANADTVFARTVPFRPVAIPKEKNDSVIAASIERMAGRPGFAEAYRALPLRTHYPPVRSILIGRDKTIWIETWTAAAEREWQILDARGNPVATVKFPAAVTILAAELGAAWGIETDADGLNSVVRYGLR